MMLDQDQIALRDMAWRFARDKQYATETKR